MPPRRPPRAAPASPAADAAHAEADADARAGAETGARSAAAAPRPLAPGLHFVATPIGTARDITLRALDTLAAAEVLAAEDTRRLRQLLAIHGIALAGRPLHPYHDHNEAGMRPRLLAALAAGRSVAYASDAGTPLVADPGFALARAAIAAGHPVHAVPGPSAVLAALTVAGLPTDRFLFAGFLPARAAGRRQFLAALAGIPATLVLLESPRRVRETLGDLCDTLGRERPAAICRELTKLHEEVRRGSLGALRDSLAAPLRGEVVLVIGGAAAADRGREEAEMQEALAEALRERPLRAAVDEVARALGLPRARVYRAALAAARSGPRSGEADREPR